MAIVDGYADLPTLKTILEIADSSSDLDALLERAITAASREFDRATNRQPAAYAMSTASARYFTGGGSLYLYPGEMAAAPTAVAVAETGDLSTLTSWSTSSDYFLTPYNAADEGQPYTGLEIDIYAGTKQFWPTFPKCVRVTAKWGYSTTAPYDVTQAVLAMAARHLKRGQQGYADVGAIAELAQLRYVKGVDPAVDYLVHLLRRQAI